MKKYRDKNWLRQKYYEEGLSQRQVAKLAGCCRQNINHWMKKLNIKARNRSQAFSGRKLSEETKQKMRERMLKNSPGGFKPGENHPNWKGGEKISHGYVYILKPEHPCSDVKGYVKRCRLIMEKHLGRYLEPKEIPHHKNEIRDDDRIENLRLFSSQSKHTTFHNIMRQNVLFK